MIIKRICPQTGIANFFAMSDPFMSVGSVAKGKTTANYDWRCYLDEPVAGTARDRASAETQLRHAIVRRRRHERLLDAARSKKGSSHADLCQN